MDLGFGGLIEKIEEYFGKTLTKLLIAGLMLLVGLWMINSMVSAVASIEALVRDENTASAVLGHALRVAVAVLIYAAGGYMLYRSTNKRVKQLEDATQICQDKINRLQELLVQAEEQTEQAKAHRARADIQIERAEVQAERAQELIREAERRWN